jgi:protein-export membrane protein SecD
MTRTDQWKLASVLLVTVIAVWYLFPSFQFYANYYNRTAQQVAGVSAAKLAELRRKAIHLGLDLQGGMHLVLEVDRSHMSAAEGRDAVERAMEILRQRIDQFGVAEPLIQKEGEDRIVIQLPGLTDRARALDLIGKTALLEFKLVRTPEETKSVIDKIDSYLATHAPAGTDSAMRKAALSSHVLSMDFAAFVRAEDEAAVQRMLATPGLDSIIPGDSQLLWGAPDAATQGMTGRYLYVVKRDPEMKGGSIATANAQIGLEATNPGAWGVSMKMTPTGRIDFSRITGANIGRNLAIVLDGVVASAPVVRDRIPSGDASITGGSFNVETARDLSIVLRAGALPAPVHVIEERSVGPSLGNDSIREGILAALIGSVMVVVFMLVYYRLSGIVAILAMVLNIFYLLAGMAGLGSTLTLPGIAGIVLTVGMSVDANVLIFERIREELRNGKSLRQSVQLGYDRAFRTILDAHVTTIISSVFLFQFGTGPIKGFAITLIIGLVANLFTAVFMTRMVFDFMLSRGKTETLSI